MNIIGIDSGPEFSAYCTLTQDRKRIGAHAWIDNGSLRRMLRDGYAAGCIVVLESPQAQDRPLGKLLRDTIWAAARFAEILERQQIECHEADERDVALWLTGNRSASNPAILQSLKDIFGDKRQVPCKECSTAGRVILPVKGSVKCKPCKGRGFNIEAGPLAGLNEHERSALAAAWWHHMRSQERRAAV